MPAARNQRAGAVNPNRRSLKVEDNLGRSETLLRRMFDLCRIGVATNMISAEKLAPGSLAEHVYAFQPAEVLALGRRITDSVALRQDYLPHDLTLYLYKQDFAARQLAASPISYRRGAQNSA